jgi:hypothetical protein
MYIPLSIQLVASDWTAIIQNVTVAAINAHFVVAIGNRLNHIGIRYLSTILDVFHSGTDVKHVWMCRRVIGYYKYLQNLRPKPSHNITIT